MAAKTPTSVRRENLGSVNLMVALFDGTVSSNDIDDNDTWASGIAAGKIVGHPWVAISSEGPNDCTIDAISDAGEFTFSASATTTGVVYVLFKDI